MGPMSPDRAQQPAEKRLDLLTARSFGGTKHRGDETALAVEHDNRLKSVFVVVGVEQPQLLAAVDRIERVANVERDPLGNRRKGLALEIHHRAVHPQRGASVELCGKVGDGVNQAADLISARASIPSLNFIPLTTFGNWF